MKKIIKRIVLGVVAVIIIAVAGLSAYLFIPRKDVDVNPTVTDASGNVYSVYEEGKTKYAVVTDAQGKVWGAEIQDDGSVGETTASLEGKVSKDDVMTTYSGPDIDVTNDVNQYTGSVNEVSSSQANVPVAASDSSSSAAQNNVSSNQAANSTNAANNSATTAADSTNAATDSTNKSSNSTTNQSSEKTLRISKYKEIFASNNYLIEFTTNDETLGDTPITAAAKNGNIIIDTQIEGITCKMLYLASKDKTYLLLDNYRMYCAVPESLMGDDFDLSDMNMGSSLASNIDVDHIETSTVNIDGKSYYCESCKTKDGGEVRYYFDGDSLVRFDTDNIDENGEKYTVSTFFSKITTNVPDETFEIPSNYKYLNVSWLNAIIGDDKNK
ncbi:MAG: hypothetical protein ACI4GY_04010 [Acutalibacteraceae bacterium]